MRIILLGLLVRALRSLGESSGVCRDNPSLGSGQAGKLWFVGFTRFLRLRHTQGRISLLNRNTSYLSISVKNRFSSSKIFSQTDLSLVEKAFCLA